MPPQHPLHSLLRIPSSCRLALLPPCRPYTLQSHAPARSLSLPRVLRPSFWSAMVPKALQTRGSPAFEWNPATPYIVLGLLVGSQAIHILWLKQDQGRALRRAEAKIGVLREVIERVQRGEEVDVEGVLGTGESAREEEWGQVLKGLEDEEVLFQSRKKRKAVREAAAADAAKEEDATQGRGREKVGTEAGRGTAKIAVESVDGVRFY
ncbi:hypothetical protein BDU57DRAFT_454939 [Ampelomyces quisqualis]|uniref:Uncharacterized protein n=1 Tax=Ampelomyces quisqualis TaxID=50730 RepID=A0A6A5QFL0_AMPQU|nr:hypothetical protein BDU57DRAFT_454939 [Ampelomyces quisqualis]